MISLIDITKSNTRLFTSIAIEVSSYCNRRCKFCPVSYSPRQDEYMSEDTFRTILSELARLKYNGRVEFYIYNEPTRDTRLPELLRIARHILPRACFMINTNGDFFTRWKDIHILFEAGLNQMQINVYSQKLYAPLSEMVAECITADNRISDNMSMYQNIGPNARAISIVRKHAGVELAGVNHISNRAGNIPKYAPPLDEPLRKMCTRPFRFLNIDWRGNAMLCCNDYYNDVDIGTVHGSSVVEIWNDTVFQVYRLRLQNKDRRLPLCSICDCDKACGYYPHMTHHVTFGKTIDKKLLEADLSTFDNLYDMIDTIERT